MIESTGLCCKLELFQPSTATLFVGKAAAFAQEAGGGWVIMSISNTPPL